MGRLIGKLSKPRTGQDDQVPSNEDRQPYATDTDNEELYDGVDLWVVTWLRRDPLGNLTTSECLKLN